MGNTQTESTTTAAPKATYQTLSEAGRLTDVSQQIVDQAGSTGFTTPDDASLALLFGKAVENHHKQTNPSQGVKTGVNASAEAVKDGSPCYPPVNSEDLVKVDPEWAKRIGYTFGIGSMMAGAVCEGVGAAIQHSAKHGTDVAVNLSQWSPATWYWVGAIFLGVGAFLTLYCFGRSKKWWC